MARVLAFQARCCEFESRLPLHFKTEPNGSFLMFLENIMVMKIYTKKGTINVHSTLKSGAIQDRKSL